MKGERGERIGEGPVDYLPRIDGEESGFEEDFPEGLLFVLWRCSCSDTVSVTVASGKLGDHEA